jgi:hypothetical protein
MKKIIAAGVMTGVALLGAATAHADGYTREEINRRICAYLDGQPTMAAMNSLAQAARVSSWPVAAEGLVMRDSVRKFCPWHIPLVNQWGNEYHTVERYGYARVAITLLPYQEAWGAGLYLGLN